MASTNTPLPSDFPENGPDNRGAHRRARHPEAWIDDLEATPLYATRLVGSTHYLVAPAGENPADFLQLEIEELQEVRSHRLGEGDPASLNELVDPAALPPRPHPLGLPVYRFRRLLHVGATLLRMAAQSPEPPPTFSGRRAGSGRTRLRPRSRPARRSRCAPRGRTTRSEARG